MSDSPVRAPLNLPIRATLRNPTEAAKQQDPKPRPNDPFRTQLMKFLSKLVLISADGIEYKGRVMAFDLSSKALVIEVEPKRRILLSNFRSIEIIGE